MCFLLAWLILLGLPVVITTVAVAIIIRHLWSGSWPTGGQVDKQGFQILQELMRILVPRGAGWCWGWSGGTREPKFDVYLKKEAKK